MRNGSITTLIKKETLRQQSTINLIASENYVSKDVREALGSVFTNKYAEGYIGKRYYAGVNIVDKLEELVQQRALKLFSLDQKKWRVNVQPLSGSPANIAIYNALVPKGARMLGLRLDMGGHLTHGFRGSASGKWWKWDHYILDKKTELIDYSVLLRQAKQWKPVMIVAGSSAYSRIIDWKNFRKIADAVGAILLVDLSHYAGLVAGRSYPSPFPYADVVMMTTHKTLRGPRGAMIFSKEKYSKFINRAVFPGLQGGPHMNQVAALGVALKEAQSPSFRKYAKQVVKNARALSNELKQLGWRIISGGTDSHLFSIDVGARGVRGNMGEKILESVGIVVNREEIPFDAGGERDPSGIRFGTPAVTTRGMKEKQMKVLARLISQALLDGFSSSIKQGVSRLTKKFAIRL